MSTSKMSTYKAVQPHTKEEAEVAFAQGDREQIRQALLGVTYYVDDREWVQNVCLDWLDRDDSSLQWTAIQCLGHLATFHRMLDLAIVLPAIQAHISDPALASVFYDALDDIAVVDDPSYFEEHWNELPQMLRDALIERGAFYSYGKPFRKRHYLPKGQGETRKPRSRDHKLVERLKRQLSADSSHDWQEYYDKRGRLLRLSFSGLGLVQLPAELWQLTSLQELEMSENQLSSLPDELGQLLNLERLDLSENHLSNLPASFGQLLNLQELALDQNEFSHLPCELGPLINLRELFLSENLLSGLSSELCQLINLQELYLSENQLSSVPAELCQLVNLLILDLSKNQLSSLPAEVWQLLNLRWLYLKENQFRTLPAEVGQLLNLQGLDLRGNQLRALPAELGQLIHLYTLELSENPQLQIPPPDVAQQDAPAIRAYLRALL